MLPSPGNFPARVDPGGVGQTSAAVVLVRNVGPVGVAVGAVQFESGVGVFTSVANRGHVKPSREAAAVECALAVVGVAKFSPVSLFMPMGGLRLESLAGVSGLSIAGWSSREHTPVAAIARAELDSLCAQVQAEAVRKEPRVPSGAESPPEWRIVATDASVGGGVGAGLGCVTTDGSKWCAEARKGKWCSTSAELASIAMAWERFGPHVHVLTDSRAAISAITGPCKFSQETRARVSKFLPELQEAFLSGVLRVEWVRGHAGIFSNEAAHRLAMAARRGRDWKVESDVTRGIYGQIISDLRARVGVQP